MRIPAGTRKGSTNRLGKNHLVLKKRLPSNLENESGRKPEIRVRSLEGTSVRAKRDVKD